MTDYEKTYTDRLHARLRDCDARVKANRRRLLVVEVLAATGWLLAIGQAVANRLAETAPAVLGVTFRVIMIGCGALTVAGWWL